VEATCPAEALAKAEVITPGTKRISPIGAVIWIMKHIPIDSGAVESKSKGKDPGFKTGEAQTDF
jgi:hypothetical protein